MPIVGIYAGPSNDSIPNVSNEIGIWIDTLCGMGYEVDIIGGDNVSEISCTNVFHYKISDTVSKTPFGTIKDLFFQVSQYLSDRNPDILIQLWKYQTHAPAVSLAGKIHDIPTIVRFPGDVFHEFHGYKFPKSAGIFVLDNLIGRIPLRTADKVVVLGPNLKREVIEKGADEAQVALIPPPRPDDCRFSNRYFSKDTREELGLDPKRPIALYVGRLTTQKGMPFLEKVIKETVSRTDFQFVLVGDGPYREIFRSQFSSTNVVLPGFVEREKIPEYYQAATVYVHPSQFEGIPLVILEALTSGTPVIAREAGDVNFVVNEVVNSENEMVDKIVRREWSSEWNNESYFLPEYQKNAIEDVVSKLC